MDTFATCVSGSRDNARCYEVLTKSIDFHQWLLQISWRLHLRDTQSIARYVFISYMKIANDIE